MGGLVTGRRVAKSDHQDARSTRNHETEPPRLTRREERTHAARRGATIAGNGTSHRRQPQDELSPSPSTKSSHVQGWTGFTPSRTPCSRGHDASQWCPKKVERCHKGTTTIATDIDVSEGLRPTQHHACHMFLPKPVARSSLPPHRLHWKKPGIARSTTTAPPACTIASPQPQHQGSVRPASPPRSTNRLTSEPTDRALAPASQATARSHIPKPSSPQRQTPASTDVDVARRRPPSRRTSRASRRTVTGSGQGNAGSGGPFLLRCR